MISVTVRDLIEALEEFPQDYPVVIDGCEVEQIVIRDEIYLSSDIGYTDGLIIKIF